MTMITDAELAKVEAHCDQGHFGGGRVCLACAVMPAVIARLRAAEAVVADVATLDEERVWQRARAHQAAVRGEG